MMPVRVSDREIARNVADIHSGKKQRSIIEHPKAVTTAPVNKDGATRIAHTRRLQWITPPDPGFNREILKLQIRRIANDNPVSGAVEFKRLSDQTWHNRRVSLQTPAVSTPDIAPVAFGRPPAHH